MARKNPQNKKHVSINRTPLRQHITQGGKAKQGFVDRADAEDYVDELNRRPQNAEYQVYLCDLCEKYHVGSKK